MGLKKIVIRGARQHNLKNISLEIPRNTLTVITGLSGSGKSSLAFRIDGVKSERGFAGTREAGNHHERVSRDFQADVLQIVLARPANRYFLQCHGERVVRLASCPALRAPPGGAPHNGQNTPIVNS